jgi:hypothetical protein
VDDRHRIDLDDPTAYGLAFADVYDRWYEDGNTEDELVALAEFIDRRCPSGVVIEIGVGSGRLADPLVERGLAVVGVDASLPMLKQCPTQVERIAADMAALPFPPGFAGRRPTVLCGFNTLFNLHSQQRLVRLLTNIASLGACFVVELMNSELLADAPQRSTGRSSIPSGPDRLIVSSTTVDHRQQTLLGRHLEVTDNNVISRPWLVRWIGLSELDAAARTVGLRLVERYSSWAGRPFTADSPSAVSVYEPAQGAHDST